MTAKKKAIVALIVGAVLGVLYAIFDLQYLGEFARNAGRPQTELVWQCLAMIPFFMLYAFGYAFGWKRCKGFLSGVAKISVNITIFSIIFHIITGKGFIKGVLIAIVILWIAIAVVWLPGIVFGVKDLLNERRQIYV